MPIYKVNDKTYDIPEDKVSGFESRYPDAVVGVYDSETGKGYDIPVSKVGRFKKRFPKWTYSLPEKDSPAGNGGTEDTGNAVDTSGTDAPAPAKTATPGWKPTSLQQWLRMEEIRGGIDNTISGMRVTADKTRRLVKSMTDEGRKKRKDAEMAAHMAGTPTKVIGLTPGTAPDTQDSNGSSSLNPNSPAVYGVKYEDGVAKTEWMLPDGSLSTSLADADKAEYGARRVRLRHEFIRRMEENGLDPTKEDDIAQQREKDLLDSAEKKTRARLAENEENIRSLYDERGKKLDEQREWRDDEGFWSNFVRIVGGAANRSVTANAPRPKQSMTDEDKSIGTYLTENQVLTDAKKLLETRKLDKSDGFMGGFWKIGNNWRNMKMGARHALSDADLYTGGVMALQKATQLMDVEEKLKHGADLTDAEVSLVYSTMLGQDVRDNIETPHGYNAAQITVEMFPFMAQMALNPASGLSRALVTKYGKSGLRKIAMKKAAQGLTGEAAESFAKRETRKLAAKTIGVQVAGDLAEASVLANTLQAPKTAADAIERYQGDVVEDEKGDLSFAGNHNLGEAIYKAETSAIIENYTEMLGEHFGIIGNAIGKGVGKGLRAVGGGKMVDAVSDMIGKIGSNEWINAIGEVEKRAHWNGTVGEVLEEEAGIVLNSIFTGDNKISDLWDADQQIDIVLGVGLFGGFVSGLKTVGYPVAKAKAKGNLRKSNSIGSWRFGEDWGEIRSKIENADEKDLGIVIRDLVRTHAKSDEQGKAIVDYAHSLMKARGYEIASATARTEGTSTPEQQDIEDSFEHGQEIANGENAREMNDARLLMERTRQRFVNSSSEDFVAEKFDGPDAVGNLLNLGDDPELRQTALDYVNARAAYNGMIQGVKDDIETRIARSDAMIDGRVNKNSGMIQPATMKDDREVFIINGNIVLMDDGVTIDTSRSSKDIIVRDENGKAEFTTPSSLLGISGQMDPEREKETSREMIREETAKNAADKIDGAISTAAGELHTILNPDGIPEEVEILGQSRDEDGNQAADRVDIMFPDGSIVYNYSTETLREEVARANDIRAAQFEEDRDNERKAIAEAARQADQSGLTNPNRRTDLMPDDYKTPYDNRPVRATRYIESGNSTGGTLYQDENGNDAVVIAAIDDNNYVGYFREYDEQGNPTNRWSAKFKNGSGIRENHRDMMLTAQELLPAGHELTEHTSVSTDGLRNLANQLKHGYELQYDEQGDIVTTEVAVNMMARDNTLGLSDYEPGSIDPARVSSEEYKEAASRLIPYMEALGLSKFNIHWEDGTMYVDHPILKRADTPQQEVQSVVTEIAETVPNSAENTEIPTENRDLGTETVPKTENSVENVQQTADDGFIPIDPELINSRTDENGNIIWNEPPQEQSQSEEPKQSALSRVPLNENGKPDFGAVDADTAWDAIVEKTSNEAMAQSFAENMVAASEAELKKAEKVKTKPTADIDDFIAADTECIANIDRAKTALDHWKKIAGTKQRRQAEADAIRESEIRKQAEEARMKTEQERADREEAERTEREEVAALKKIDKTYADVHAEVKEYPEAVERLKQQQPEDILEAAALALSINKLLWGDKAGSKGVASETGFKEGERKGLFSMFASKEKGGKSIARLAEDEMKQICDANGIPYNNSAARDALIEIISQSRIPSDITRFIRRRRIDQAREIAEGEQRREREAFEEWTQENYHMTADDYEAYHENVRTELANDHENFDFDDFYGTLADELIKHKINQNEILHERGNQGYGSQGEGQGFSGGSQILSSPQSGTSQRSEEDGGRPGFLSQNGDNLLYPGGTLDQATSESSGRIDDSSEREGSVIHEEGISSIGEGISEAESVVNTSPTEAQKKAGNYKKGHVQVGTFDVTIENPKGSKRSGTDADGKKWETTMTHTYGYILGTKGVDGDHIDVYISSDIDGWNGRKVFVVDQYNPDGSFDEHKVMLGFNDKDEAFEAYLSNYEAGWEKGRRLDVTAANLDDFEKWIESSKRKTKAFTEYAGVKVICPVCGKAGIPNYHNHDVVCPQCNSDLSVFRQIDQLSENEKQELSDKFIGEDNQGNPIDHAGKLIVEDVTSIDDITDEDFVNPTRTIGLPKLPNAVSDAIGSKNKRVIIKKNIFGKNHKNHKELTPSESREILRTALYTPSLYGRNQKQTRPYNWILIHLADKSTCVLLEVDNSKENCEIVNWHYLSGETLARKKRQAIKEGGRILTLSENNVAADTHDGLPSDDKGNTLSTDKQTESAESSDGYTIEPRKDTRDNSDIFAVKFEERVSREVFKGQKAIAKKHGGYWSNFGKKGFLFKTREDAEAFANEVMGKPNEAVAEDAPLSLEDIRNPSETPTKAEYKVGDVVELTTGDRFVIRHIRPDGTMHGRYVQSKLHGNDVSGLRPEKIKRVIERAETEPTTEKEISPASITHKAEKPKSKWVDDEDAEEFERLRKILRNGLGQLNSGFPPELLYAGGKMSYLMMKHGVRKFAEYATAMIEELGDAIRPHLKSLYNFTRSTEEVMESGWADELTPFDEVMKFDTANFGKPNVDAMATAENVVAEEASQQHIEDAVTTIKDTIRQNSDGSISQTINEGGTEIEVTEGDFIPGVYPPIDDKPTKPGKKKPSKPKPTEPKQTTGQLDLFGEEEEQIINDVIEDTTAPKTKPEAELSGDSAAYQERTRQERDLVDDIVIEIMKRTNMREQGDDKVTLTMRDIRGMLENYNLLADISTTDLQEFVERAMTILTRTAAKTYQADPRKGYDRVVAYYNMQPSLNARDSERLIKQQYSTPTPFGYVMGQFVNAKNDVKSVLEPSAGNGALTIMFDPATVHVNDIDERRLENLRTLGYGTVTAQNGLLPFEGEKVDGVLTNPPFGSVTEKVYDGVFKISSLEGQMAINALDSMKDGGRAAIIIGGNTSYRTNGSMNPKDAAFFGYLYSHYNVADVINISGKALYARNGTGYDVRMILINGRKTGEFSRVYPPVKSKARAEQVTTFDELYKRVQDDIQQVFQVGHKPTDEKPEGGRAADGGTSTPVRSGGNNPNKGAGERPDTTGNGSGSASGSHIEQPSSGNGGSRPVGVDNGDAGNAGGTDNVQRPQSSASGSNGSGSPQNDGGRSGGNGRDATSSRPNSSGERLAVKPDLTTEKVPYPNQSDNGFTLLSVVPAAQAEVLQRSLAEIGDVDQFLVDELGYSSKEELYSYLAAEQIDSVALAIHQMNKGNAFIIGDMTGVGKGRQGAALIRYGVRQGRCPIYFTQKPTLFTDNYRDLADIGSSELHPFIIASNPKDANIVDANGNVVHKLPSKKEQERVFDYIMQNGKLPKEYDYVLTTYDQIKNGTADYSQNEDGTWNTEARKLPKKSKGYTTADYNGQARRDALARLAMGVAPGEGNIAILDESHTVGGDSGCGRYMQMLTSGAYGVTFLSATFAKRADNMPIYAQRTAIAEAGVNANELIEAIAKGGVTLQEIMSKQLVESGQMIRRERSFEGVTIDWLSVEEDTDRKQREQFNEVADIFNSIRNFQNDFIKPIIDGMNEDAAETGGTVGQTQGTKDMGVRNTPFASKMYNLVNQLLFALKVDAVADRVIENLRNGFKPVISFTNTMEGFLASAPKGVAMDEVPNFSLTLMRALDGVMRFTENDADQNSEGGQITVGQLSPEGQAAYNAIKGKIMNLSADLPISPMDAIRMKIEEAGYTVAEITGRTTQLNRTEDGRYIVEGRKDRDKKAAMRDFNAGKLDVLMINKSGSTGISLHASSKFEDQRQRVMVFAQFQSDINDEVQMRGRIDRSGQVVRGRYEYIMSTIPAEQRIQMMFKAKLKSLDANTTSSQKSKFNEMEIVDYLNKYGDEVVWEYMKEHPELSDRLGDPLKMLQDKDEDGAARTSEKEDSSQKSDCAGKISRYLAFLSVEEQDEIFKEITEAYKVKIQLLDDAGENDLEITTMPLRAETKSKQIWHNGENPGSGNAFADNTYVEEVEVDVLKKPMKRTEIEDMIRKLMGDKITTATKYDQTRYGMKDGELNWGRYADKKIEEVNNFFRAKADDAVAKMKEAGESRVSKAREKSVKDALKARAKGENTFSDQEIEALADVVAKEAQDKEEMKQYRRREEINNVRDQIKHLLSRLRAGHIYVVPQDLKQATADMFTQTFGTFVGFKFNKSYTLGSSTAIFATLDGRRKVELALNDKAIETIIRCTDTALRYSPNEINAISMDNWDSKVPTKTRQTRYIITGNLLQALVDTEKGEKTKGNLISFSTNDGNTRQGILMSENFKPTDLRSSVPLRSRLKQIQDGITVVSENGDVQIERVDFDWKHRGEYELKVPKSKQRGGIYSMHTDLLKLIDGHNFNSKGNYMIGYILPENLAKVVDMLSRAPFNLTVLEESKLTEAPDSSQRNVEDDSDLRFRIREEEPPKQTGVGYKVFVLKDGQLYPPMVANPNGEATPVGVWLDADAAPIAGTSKTGRQQVKAGGKGTQGGSGKLAYRPGWHLGVIPYALQFNRKGESGEKELFPANFVWAEVEYADDIDYQDEAMSYGYNKNGKFQHSYAGLPRLPINGAYKYRTNPNPETDPWIITGAMKVNRLLTPTEVDEMVISAGRGPQKRQTGAITDEQINELNSQFAQRERDGYGAYSDAEVSMENDPWSKAWGESIRTKRQQKQFAERERKRMRDRAKSLSSVLGIDIEVIEDTSSLKGKKQRAKGWYDTKTGKITVVVGNHNSAADMEATILHEAVAHHGLRQLLGEHFDEFLDKVYEAADNGIKEQIDLLASRNGWNRRVATEEYLAGLAEETEFDRAEERVGGWFDKIKRFFIDMLFKAGFKHIKPGSIGDNELRYILWRSYQNLANPGRYRAFEWEAEDVAMQYKLQIGQYDTTSEKVESAADSGIRFRDGDFTPRDRKLAADVYEKMLSRGSWQFREATQDSMLGLKTLYESILGSNTRIENVAGHENAYLYENRMSSANNGEQHQYFSRFMKPLLDCIHKLCGNKELDRRILTDYMMAKHGLERNEYMRNEAAANGEDTERDFAGLCGLTGEDDWQVAESVAQQMVDDYESDHDTAELWNNVKKATNATLEKIYLSGLISEDTYNKVLGMYDFYIPLRGWDETTSDEVYGYLTSKDGPLMGNVFKTAGGRESKADDPIATIAMMADDAIRQGNRNIMKQRFLNFVHGNPSDLVSVNEMWLQHNDVTDEWEPVFADLQPDMTHAEVESEIAKFEAKMEALRTSEPNKYKKGRDARNIPYKVVRENLKEHQVLVKRNGRTYVMTINGNPRAAQALNGLTNPDTDMGGVYGKMIKGLSYINRHMSAFYTTRNPDFVVSNFMRDMLYSNCMTWVKENPRYALRFHKNFGKVNPLTLRKLLSKWENDNLSDSNYLEKMFKEFMLNGGETGYTSVKDIDGHKRTIASELKKQGSTGRKAWSALGMQLDLLNRSAENCARFAAFLTSREMGRTLDRSIYDAKEVSVNFNKKGSGDRFVDANGQTALGKIGGYLGGVGRSSYVFWNAGIQGMTNFGRAGKRNPGKAIGGAAALFTLGYVIPLLAQMLGGGDGDDDDKNAYYNLPEYVRRSNICFKAGEQWITIPLPIEYRAIYGMGELACGVISGNERYSNSELARQMAAQVSQIMPLDMLEGGGGFSPLIPSAAKPYAEAYIMNKGWTGLPIAKDSPFNKYEPEWKRVYQSTDQHLVEFSRWLNQTTGGNDYKKGVIDINPAKLEYLLSGTFGGMVSFPMKIKKGWFETPFGDRDFEWRTQPFFNRVVKSGDERTANRKLINEYFKYKDEAENTEYEFKGFMKEGSQGILESARRADFLYNSPEFLRYQIFDQYDGDIQAMKKAIDMETDESIKKEMNEIYYSYMREAVKKLREADKKP